MKIPSPHKLPRATNLRQAKIPPPGKFAKRLGKRRRQRRRG